MPKERKKWQTPKLICLYRGRPEESVLQGCKVKKGPGPAQTECKFKGVNCFDETAT